MQRTILICCSTRESRLVQVPPISISKVWIYSRYGWVSCRSRSSSRSSIWTEALLFELSSLPLFFLPQESKRVDGMNVLLYKINKGKREASGVRIIPCCWVHFCHISIQCHVGFKQWTCSVDGSPSSFGVLRSKHWSERDLTGADHIYEGIHSYFFKETIAGTKTRNWDHSLMRVQAKVESENSKPSPPLLHNLLWLEQGLTAPPRP